MFVFNDACECVSEIWNCAAFLFFFSFGSVCMCVLFFSSCAKLKCRDGGDKKATERRRDSLVFYSRFFFFFGDEGMRHVKVGSVKRKGGHMNSS